MIFKNRVLNKWIIVVLLFIILYFLFFATKNNAVNTETITNNENNIDMYVITLKHTVRLQNIAEQESKIGSKIQLIDAVYGPNLNVDEHIKSGLISPNYFSHANDENVRKREYGCYMSHLSVYNLIKHTQNDGYSILFEDDFTITTNDFIKEVNNAIQTINDKKVDFDMLYLGNTNENHGTHLADDIYYVNHDDHIWGNYAILINNKNIDKIIEGVKTIELPIDDTLKKLYDDGKITLLSLYPTIVSHRYDIDSTIR